jgi:hypothetical protein
MNVDQLKFEPEQARELWKKYQSHRVHQNPADAEIAAIYKRIAQGKTVIRAFASIAAAGVNAQGLPKLAIARADQPLCYLHHTDNTAVFSPQRWFWHSDRTSRSKLLRVPWEGFTMPRDKSTYEAQVPLIPVHLRPKRGLQNYHILWEAEWTKRYPVDPFLLRRFGGDAWLVVAAWDLTEVERAVMSSRLRS